MTMRRVRTSPGIQRSRHFSHPLWSELCLCALASALWVRHVTVAVWQQYGGSTLHISIGRALQAIAVQGHVHGLGQHLRARRARMHAVVIVLGTQRERASHVGERRPTRLADTRKLGRDVGERLAAALCSSLVSSEQNVTYKSWLRFCRILLNFMLSLGH